MKTKILLSISVLLVGFAQAQDPVFSQFYNSAVYLNPALVGEENDIYFNFSHRSQWRSLDYPYSTFQTSLIYPLYKDKHRKPAGHLGGLGISAYTDRAGEADNFKSTGVNASIAYNLPFSTKQEVNQLSLALQFGIINRNIDTKGLKLGEQYNEFIGFDENVVPDLGMIQNNTFLDITFGAFYRYYLGQNKKAFQSFYLGAVVSHLNHPDQSVIMGQEDRLPLLYKAHGGAVFGLSQSLSMSLNFLTMLQDKENQTNVGTFFSYNLPLETKGHLTNMLLRLGGWYRINDSAIMTAGIVTNHLQFAFSYDWNVTSLKFNSRGTGAYEISMGYRFFKPATPKVLY